VLLTPPVTQPDSATAHDIATKSRFKNVSLQAEGQS